MSDFSAGEAEAKDTSLMLSITLIAAYFSGQEYYNAQTIWNNPNTCVEITFTPPTKTKKFVPRESTPVKTELRTKKEQAIVPAKFKEAKERPREGNGLVSPREEKSEPNRPATFTYQAPATKVQHSGFRVSAVSRAGVAEAKDGEWELAPSAYVVEFKSHIVMSPVNLGIISAGGFDAHVQATVPLRRRENDGEWVGEGVMQYATRPLSQPAPCEVAIQGAGTTTFHVNGGSISSDPEPFAVNLIILPGQTGEVTESRCTSGTGDEKLEELAASQGRGIVQSGAPFSARKDLGWTGAFSFTRRTTFDRARQGYKIEGWTPVRDSEVIAQKTMSVNCTVVELLACQEETTLTLRLADEPGAAASQP